MSAVIEQSMDRGATSERERVAEFRMPGPGERLRAARLSAGIGLDQVAHSLHLDKHTVESLEGDRYDQLPEQVFVQGYVRNYARLVGLPVESVAKQLAEHCPTCEPRHFRNTSAEVRRELQGGDLLFRLLTLGLVMGVVVLGFIWWQVDFVRQGEVATAVSTESVAAPAPSLAPVGEADGSLRLPVRAAPADRAPPAPVPPPAVPEVVRPQPTAIASPPRPAESTTSGPVVLTFSSASWVDIRDATGKSELGGKIVKGTRKTLSGKPPYKMVIGKAAAVRVTVAGQAYDIERYTRGNVARFTLNP